MGASRLWEGGRGRTRAEPCLVFSAPHVRKREDQEGGALRLDSGLQGRGLLEKKLLSGYSGSGFAHSQPKLKFNELKSPTDSESALKTALRRFPRVGEDRDNYLFEYNSLFRTVHSRIKVQLSFILFNIRSFEKESLLINSNLCLCVCACVEKMRILLAFSTKGWPGTHESEALGSCLGNILDEE